MEERNHTSAPETAKKCCCCGWGAFLVGLVVALILGWAVLPALMQKELKQPVAFNHVLHVDEQGIDCAQCHFTGPDGQFSGVPTTATYCIMAATCAPILVRMGVPMVAAHFFVFYFGIVADITPPVALAAYAGSAIAKSNPMKTGINATKLAIAAFIVPYIFAYSPALLFENISGWWEVAQITVSALLGIFAIAASLNGFLYKKIHWVLRLVLAIGGLGMMIPGTLTDVVGLALVAAVIVYQKLRAKKNSAPQVIE